MNLNFLSEFIMPVNVGICLCVGFVVKKWLKDIEDKYIPTICAIVGLVISMWINGWRITPEVVLGGLFSGLASTGLHQAFKQLLRKPKEGGENHSVD